MLERRGIAVKDIYGLLWMAKTPRMEKIIFRKIVREAVAKVACRRVMLEVCKFLSEDGGRRVGIIKVKSLRNGTFRVNW